MNGAAMKKAMSRDEAVAAIAAILGQVSPRLDLEEICADAEAIAQRARDARRLRRTYRGLRDEYPSWAAFVADAIEIGEWDESWGIPPETE